MGSNQSTVGYSRLRHPSNDSLRKPLLGLDDRQMVVEKGQNRGNSTLKINSQSPSSKAAPHKEHKTEVNPEKEVRVLKLRIATLEKKQEKVSEINKKMAALEKSVMKLTSTINESKRTTESGIRDPIPNLIDLDPVPITMEPNNGVIVKNPTKENMLIMPDREFQVTDQENELVGCLVVVIFLLGIVIGLNCY